jgi:hypothetical protein
MGDGGTVPPFPQGQTAMGDKKPAPKKAGSGTKPGK